MRKSYIADCMNDFKRGDFTTQKRHEIQTSAVNAFKARLEDLYGTTDWTFVCLERHGHIDLSRDLREVENYALNFKLNEDYSGNAKLNEISRELRSIKDIGKKLSVLTEGHKELFLEKLRSRGASDDFIAFAKKRIDTELFNEGLRSQLLASTAPQPRYFKVYDDYVDQLKRAYGALANVYDIESYPTINDLEKLDRKLLELWLQNAGVSENDIADHMNNFDNTPNYTNNSRAEPSAQDYRDKVQENIKARYLANFQRAGVDQDFISAARKMIEAGPFDEKLRKKIGSAFRQRY